MAAGVTKTSSDGVRRDGVTLDEITQELGVTRARVRQIEKGALEECRRWARRHGFKLDDLLPGC